MKQLPRPEWSPPRRLPRGRAARWSPLFTSPPRGASRTATGAVPPGNGDRGATLSGAPEALRFRIDKNGFWRLQNPFGRAMRKPIGAIDARSLALAIALLVAGSLLAGSGGAGEASPPALVPRPLECAWEEGGFEILESTRVLANAPARAEARALVASLAPATGWRLALEAGSAAREGTISIAVGAAEESLGAEGYRLRVAPSGITIRAAARAGAFYAIQTLRQLLPPEVYLRRRVEGVRWIAPAVAITDRPRFPWRGLLVDPARHFIPLEDLFRFIDVMAIHKLNRLQIHLSDSQGWRVEIRKHPKLAAIGSRMDFTSLRRREGRPEHGGFYRQEDIHRLVRYAAERHITIVPEIEMPAHTGAAIVAYPRLGSSAEELRRLAPEKRWGKAEGVITPRPETVAFFQDVLAEIIELFPGPYIHIGGDEANVALWQKSGEMRAQMRKLGLANVRELHSWFIRQMDAFVAGRGRRLVGWDEILQGGLAPGATVMSWRGEAGGIAAARAGHDVVMAPTSHTYFDYYQGPRAKEPPAIGGFVPLEKVCGYEPLPAGLDREAARHVLGAQGQLWGEFMPERRQREYMAYPRAAALAEAVWSPREGRDVTELLARIERHLRRLDALGVSYRPLERALFPVKLEAHAERARRAARALAERIVPDRADRFQFEVIAPERGRDRFEIESRGEKIAIRASGANALATGLGWYLEHVCGAWIGLHTRRLELPDPLPRVSPKLRRASWARYRYFLNYCCFGYSLPWWDWPRWERLIDWMALHGVNLPLAVTGQEAVWRATGRRLGLREEEIASFLAGPPYLPFGWMGCLDGWGGPLPAGWIERHEELSRKILARERELGMTPVLQGFTGHVPRALSRLHPEAKVYEVSWIEWKTRLLDPLDPLYAEVARIFMEEQARRFGSDHCYAADTFIEMTPPSGDPEFLAALARAIHRGMAASDPRAVWVLQGWTFMNQARFWTPPRRRAFLDAIEDERMLVLDLFCESTPMWSRTEAFDGKPWLWCNVQNFGGTVHLGGALERNNRGLPEALASAKRGKLVGLGMVNEGLGYNPPAYQLMFEMAWRREPVDLEEWVVALARRRYGRASPAAEHAWRILLDTVYDAPHRARSIIDTAPRLGPSPGVPYDTVRLAEAWRLLLEASPSIASADPYRFDLANVARQVLSNHTSTLHRAVVKAYRAKDLARFEEASERFLASLQDLDELLATRPEFLLGRWIEEARRWGADETARARLEWDARRVLTLWGPGPAIRDYARKEWSGMVGGFYRERWRHYLDGCAAALREGRPLDEKRLSSEILEWEKAWASGKERFPSRPSGDTVETARRLWVKYGGAFRPEVVSLTTGKPATCSTHLPGRPPELACDGFVSDTDRFWAMDVSSGKPAWWQVDLERRTRVGRVVVIGYFGDRRRYGFTVEASLDGRHWDLLADRRDNREPSTREGTTCRFEPRPARFLRVTQTSNSANTGRHLVEVLAFER